jgi:predicted RNA binding protein YcfA (HicA-like mRNA interferase family)
MPKLPLLSGQEVVRALERPDFEQVRQRGSHVLMRRGSALCVVPMHKEVRGGTLAGIPRQAQIAPDDFIKAVAQ